MAPIHRQYELDIQDMDPTMLLEKQLKERVNKELNGGAISYAYSKAELEKYAMWKGFKGWFKREKWWFLGMFLLSAWCGAGFMSMMLSPGMFWFWCWTFSIWLGMLFAFCIGTTNGSRGLVILSWCTVGGIVVSACAIVYRDLFYY